MRTIKLLLPLTAFLWACGFLLAAPVAGTGAGGAGVPGAPPSVRAPAREIRGLWVVRGTLCSAKGVRGVVAAAQENGFNALFVQVRGRGETYYESDIDPIARCLGSSGEAAAGDEDARDARDAASPDSGGFDPLRLLIDLAHESGIEVHAWVNMYLTWSEEDPHPSPLHVVNRHPEWITADRNGVRLDKLNKEELKSRLIEGIYLSPAIPEVRSYLTDVAAEIASRYDIDGLHLDYVRYPGRYSGLDGYSRDEFGRLHMFDPIDFLNGSGGNTPPIDTYWAKDLGALWEQWRADQVTALVSSISQRLRSIRPGAVLSAAVRPNPAEAARDYGQDWTMWLEDGLIDLAAPMLYTESTKKFFKSIGLIRRTLPDSLEPRILAGISLYNQGPRHAAEKIEIARAASFAGFVLFSYDSAVERKGSTYLPSLKPQVLKGGR